MPKRDKNQTDVHPMSAGERRQAEAVATRPTDAVTFAPVDGDQATEEDDSE